MGGERIYQLTIYFLETNTVIPLGGGGRTFLVQRMRALAKELGNAGVNVVSDQSNARTAYPMICLETPTGADIQLQVSDLEGDDI